MMQTVVIVNAPLHDALVCADDGGLNVDGVVPHPPQLHGLLQRSNHKQSIVSLCSGTEAWFSPAVSKIY